MQHLIIVRHGNYDAELKLSGSGRKQMEVMAGKLEPFHIGEVRLISSTADRAVESAGVFGAAWDLRIRAYDVLWSQQSHPENLPEALKLIRANMDADTLVVVTHLEYTEELPPYFGKHELKTTFPRGNIEKGEAIVIGYVNKTFTYIR